VLLPLLCGQSAKGVLISAAERARRGHVLPEQVKRSENGVPVKERLPAIEKQHRCEVIQRIVQIVAEKYTRLAQKLSDNARATPAEGTDNHGRVAT
jgi:hypothetical protein